MANQIATTTDDALLLRIDARIQVLRGLRVMSEASHPRLEPVYLASGLLTPVHARHRELLRWVMAAGGFTGIDNMCIGTSPGWSSRSACPRRQA